MTWGESHGRAIGAVIDGCPSGLEIGAEDIQAELFFRQGGKPYTTPRKEADVVEILSGVFEGKTTGAPISVIIYNQDKDPSKYSPIQEVLRPGHANFTYLEKYGIFDYRGGGRASGRETACRVAAGAIAKKILRHYGIDFLSYIQQIGEVKAKIPDQVTKTQIWQTPLLCPDVAAALQMETALLSAIEQKDSLGGVIECIFTGLPIGLGDPVYEKLEANLAKAMLSIPACKGVEFGAGFRSSSMKGSEHNDLFHLSPQNTIETQSNHAGGLLGGISTGMPLKFRCAMKPTSSIQISQPSLNLQKQPTLLQMPEGSRHDPCLALRAVAVVEAMAALVIVDAIFMNRSAKL